MVLLGMGARRTSLLFVAFLSCATGDPSRANGPFTAYEFAVAESGDATVTVPIQVPRGIAGMEPQLSINYSSRDKNGLLGLGWSLSGISAITRCPRTVATDGVHGAVSFDANDRFCLDGQRLVLTQADGTRIADQSSYGSNGAEYRTERDTFSRIRSYGGTPGNPERFRVWTKAGHIVEYGTTANSRVPTNFLAPNVPAVTSRWMAERVEDRSGNYIRFQYCQGRLDPAGGSCLAGTYEGSATVHYIQYTNRDQAPAVTGTSVVFFGYEDREDPQLAFHAGSRSRQTQRLKRVETYVNWANESARGTLVRRYVLTYEPLLDGSGGIRATTASRLASIQEVSGDANASPLPPLQVSLSSDRVFGQATTQGSSQAGPPVSIGEPCGGVTQRGNVFLLCP